MQFARLVCMYGYYIKHNTNVSTEHGARAAKIIRDVVAAACLRAQVHGHGLESGDDFINGWNGTVVHEACWENTFQTRLQWRGRFPGQDWWRVEMMKWRRAERGRL